jgi:hypothetical protein
MKLFHLLLAGALLAPGAALAGNNNNGNGCRNRCGATPGDVIRDNTYASGDNRGNDYSGDRNNNNGNSGIIGNRNRVNNGTVNRGANAGGSIVNRATGGAGGQGGQGGAGGSVRHSGNSTNRNNNRNRNNNTNTNAQGQQQGQGQSQSNSNLGINSSSNSNRSRSNSASGANNTGNAQSTTVNVGGDTHIVTPEATVAPQFQGQSTGAIGDIIVPLPTIGLNGFATRDLDGWGGQRDTYGVTFGFNVPLGAGEFREYATAEAQRREDRGNFRLIQEAIFLRDNGVLSKEAHPRHWAALYGAEEVAAAEKFSF